MTNMRDNCAAVFRNWSKQKALSSPPSFCPALPPNKRWSSLHCHIAFTCCHPMQLDVHRCFIMLGMGVLSLVEIRSAVVLCLSHGPDQESPSV